MTEQARKQKRNFFSSIRFRIRIVILLVSVLLIAAVEITMIRSVRNAVEKSMVSRMEGDINYIEDLIWKEDHIKKEESAVSNDMTGEDDEWSIQDGALFYGSVLIGDGTAGCANLEPFLEMERKTGSFSYTLVRCPDEGLVWDTDGGYQQGHYLRVAGSTTDSSGNTIVGTYMDKKVADMIDEKDSYTGRANVVGTQVFCLYRALTDREGNTVGVIVVGRSIEDMEAQTRQAARILFWLVAISVILADIILNALATRWIAKLDIANHYLMDISTGNIPGKPLDLHTRDELSVTSQCINEMTVALKEKERISGELKAASHIQMYMLPNVFPAFPDRKEFDIYAAMHPAKEVGGDFYDFFMIDEDHLAAVIADVSGKGVPAAMFMATAKTLIKNHARMGLQPREVFTKSNLLLCEGNETAIFVTAWMGVLEISSGKLTYVNAGHNPPLISTEKDGFGWLRSDPGKVLGVFDDVQYDQNELMLSPGDRLFLYTDGVTEAMDCGMKLYGNERLCEYLNVHRTDSAKDMLSGIKSSIDAFAGEQEQFDDITMLMLDYFGKGSQNSAAERVFRNSEEQLTDAVSFVEETLTGRDLPAKITAKINVAVEEVFSNTAKYAYPGGEGLISIKVYADDRTVKIRFTDSGIPFDPLKEETPDITVPAQERDVGGLGIFLVRQMMDEVDYRREGDRNVLTLTLKV